MSNSVDRLPVVPLPGLRPESLGNYLASLGLLRILARRWPSVRVAWCDHVLHVVGGPPSLEELLDQFCRIADARAWTVYQRGWAAEQKKSTKLRSGVPLAIWQATAEEEELELFAAHAVAQATVSFNPLLGTGGNTGKRAFSDGWKKAVEALAPASPTKPWTKRTRSKSPSREKDHKRAELERLVLGKPLTWMVEELNAASWFSEGNKLYNSGQKPYREGAVSPWAMALACEGLPFWAGGASRRLGNRARAQGAFPFISYAAAPGVVGEAGRELAEVWAPLWDRPMTLPEVRALFARGRAEVRGRGVLTPGAFAAAIMRRGVDGGISKFIRFSLGRTTSSQTFEPRFEGTFTVQTSLALSPLSAVVPVTLQRALTLIDQLPADRKVGQRWRFVGLRGPIEAAVLRLAAAPGDPESAVALLDAMLLSLDRVDRNRGFRERRVSWEPLPIEWLPALFLGDPPGIELRLAMALVSALPVTRPFTLYRFGVEARRGRFEHSERPPARWLWAPGALPRVLATIVMRCTLDWQSDGQNEHQPDDPVRALMPASAAHVDRWLDGAVDDALLARWISRFALFDWSFVPSDVRKLATTDDECADVSARLSLFGLLQPLFDRRPVRASAQQWNQDLLPRDSGARTPSVARALAAVISSAQFEIALRLVRSRYAMAGARLTETNVPWRVADADRLLASVLFPIADHERTLLIERWLRPRRQQGD